MNCKNPEFVHADPIMKVYKQLTKEGYDSFSVIRDRNDSLGLCIMRRITTSGRTEFITITSDGKTLYSTY